MKTLSFSHIYIQSGFNFVMVGLRNTFIMAFSKFILLFVTFEVSLLCSF